MKAPYYAVIFTSNLTQESKTYTDMAIKMEALAQSQPGFLGVESARESIGITVSYWESLEAIVNWKSNTEHLFAQKMGKSNWYQDYAVRICKVEREYNFTRSQ